MSAALTPPNSPVAHSSAPHCLSQSMQLPKKATITSGTAKTILDTPTPEPVLKLNEKELWRIVPKPKGYDSSPEFEDFSEELLEYAFEDSDFHEALKTIKLDPDIEEKPTCLKTLLTQIIHAIEFAGLEIPQIEGWVIKINHFDRFTRDIENWRLKAEHANANEFRAEGATLYYTLDHIINFKLPDNFWNKAKKASRKVAKGAVKGVEMGLPVIDRTVAGYTAGAVSVPLYYAKKIFDKFA